MKTRFFVGLVSAGLLGAGLVGTVGAAEGPVRADVPFAFVVNGTELPSGAYEISSLGHIVVLRGPQDTTCVLGSELNSSDGGRARLVFHKRGEVYFLHQVWPSAGFGHEIAPSRKGPERTRLAYGPGSSEVVVPASP